MLGDEFKSSGITENTPKTVMLGAGTIHKGLTFDSSTSKWNFEESLICATSGGSKLSITPEFYDVPVDGALVKVKGLTVKVGETATLEINPIELTADILKMALIGDEKESETATGYNEITSRARINEGDYLENMGYVGKTIDGTPIIIVFDYALCTSGLELEGKNKEAAVPTFTFECMANLTPEADTLPWHVYYPTPTSPATIDPTGISVNPQTASVGVDETRTITATLEPEGATGEITWSVQDNTKATFLIDGVPSNTATGTSVTIKGLASGTTPVVATCNSYNAACIVTVTGE